MNPQADLLTWCHGCPGHTRRRSSSEVNAQGEQFGSSLLFSYLPSPLYSLLRYLNIYLFKGPRVKQVDEFWGEKVKHFEPDYLRAG